MQQSVFRRSPLQRHLERRDCQVPVVDGTERPAHHEAREQIEYRGEIQLAARPDGKLRRVADPPLIGPRGGELTIQEIRGHRLIVVAHGRAPEPFPRPRLQPVFLHQSHHAFPAHPNLLLEEILMNPGTAIPLLALRERRPYQ
jgi:hypothetical protein